MVDKIIDWLKNENIHDPFIHYVKCGLVTISETLYTTIFLHIEEDIKDPTEKTMAYTRLYGILVSNNNIKILDKYKLQFDKNMYIEYITKHINYDKVTSETWEYLIENDLILDDAYLDGFCYHSPHNFNIELYKRIFKHNTFTGYQNVLSRKILKNDYITNDDKRFILMKIWRPDD